MNRVTAIANQGFLHPGTAHDHGVWAHDQIPDHVPLLIAAKFRDRIAGFLVKRPEPCILLIAPCSSIHTFGMRNDLDVAFFDSRGVVIKIARSLKPGQLLRCRDAYGVLERRALGKQKWYTPGERVMLHV